MTRSVEAQLATARMLFAQFHSQIDEFEAMNREARRTDRGRDLANRIDQLRSGWGTWEDRVRELGGEIEITHACPPGDAGLTPCCGRTPFELPRTDRMTLEAHLVNCKRKAVSS